MCAHSVAAGPMGSGDSRLAQTVKQGNSAHPCSPPRAVLVLCALLGFTRSQSVPQHRTGSAPNVPHAALTNTDQDVPESVVGRAAIALRVPQGNTYPHARNLSSRVQTVLPTISALEATIRP